MKGQVLKDAIRQEKKTQADFAEYMGMTQANVSALLNADNVKTETLEAVAAFLGRPAGSFYGEGNTATTSGTNNTSVAGHGNILNDRALIEEIAAQRRMTEQALTQNDRLIGIIEDLTKQ